SLLCPSLLKRPDAELAVEVAVRPEDTTNRSVETPSLFQEACGVDGPTPQKAIAHRAENRRSGAAPVVFGQARADESLAEGPEVFPERMHKSRVPLVQVRKGQRLARACVQREARNGLFSRQRDRPLQNRPVLDPGGTRPVHDGTKAPHDCAELNVLGNEF